MLSKKLGTIFVACFLFSVTLYGQEDVLTLVPYNQSDPSTFVNAQIVADTTATNGLLPTRVYELTRDQFYLFNAIVNIRAGITMRLRGAAGEGKKPIVFLDATGTGANPTRPPGNMFVLNGGNLEMKDICVAGYLEDFPERLGTVQGGLIQTGAAGSTIILDGVVLSNINGQHVRTNSSTAKIQITNSIFANMGALTTSNLGAGKGVDLREVAHDSVIFVNNTFVNYQDRAIRHLTLSSSTSPGAIKYLKVDHNTFINGMGYHGLLSLGSVGDQIIITNNLFYDAFALGEDPSDSVRTSEWLNTGETYSNGYNRITWIFSEPNSVTQWTVDNNYYALSPEGIGWLNLTHFGFGQFGVGSPLSYHINSKLGADSINAFTREDAITLGNKPNLMTAMMTWYESPTGGERRKNTPSSSFVAEIHDYDRRKIEYFRDTLDASYSTSSAAYTGGSGYPAGDLNWFPDKKAEWEAGVQPFGIVIDGEKDEFYNTLTGPDDGYLQIRYFAWNDNGRPRDDDDLSAKVWAAWDADWLYYYTEVKDDTISGSGANSYQDDGLELKIDPIPTTTANSIFAPNLTILGGTGSDSLNVVTAPNKQWIRKQVPGGYVLELAIKWSAVVGGTETVHVGVDSVFGLAINYHDNDHPVGGTREHSVQWAAVLLDNVWNTPANLGTVKFLADNKLQFIPTNNFTPANTNNVPYDGSDHIRVGVEDDSPLPVEFGLSQNYPNPFNPSTKITFTLKEHAFTVLSVYNVLGQKVATLVSNELPSGTHQVNFDASNFSSGVYMYKLESGSNVSTKKMLLMK